MGKIMYNTYESVESSLNNMKTAVLDLDDIDGELSNIKFDNPEFGNIQVALENAKKAVKSNVQTIKSNIENDVSIALNAKSEFMIFESKSNSFLDADFNVEVTLDSIKHTIVSNNIGTMKPETLMAFIGYNNGEGTVDYGNSANAIADSVESTSPIGDESINSSPNVEVKEPEISSEVDNSSYIVKQGDSLAKIAALSGVSLSSLISANPQIEDPNLILVGDKINIPVTNSKDINKDESKNNEFSDIKSDSEDKNNSDVKPDDIVEQISADTSNVNDSSSTKADFSATINYRTNSVDGNRIVAGDSGYTINEVLTKIKDECIKQGLEEHWVDVCAISLWETGNYTSGPFANNNIGGLTYADGQTRYAFSSFDDGITSFVSNLKNNYYDKGLTSINSIAPKYCPPTSSDWASNVNIMKNQIERCL